MSASRSLTQRTLFGEEEEEIIGEFLVSCWKKNLQVPNDTLFETLKKHLHIYPRSSQSRSNKPSPAWKKNFLERNPSVQEAYDNHKKLLSKKFDSFDVVSEALLGSLLEDLATVKMPSTNPSGQEPETTIGKLASNTFDIKHGRIGFENRKQRRATQGSKSPLAFGRKPVTSAPLKERKRSKTLDGQGFSGSELVMEPNSGRRSAKSDKAKERKSTGRIKLSAALFTKHNAATRKIIASTQQGKAAASASDKEKTKLKTKESLTPETSARRRKRDSITPDAVPRNPVKFEEGASIEAVDCGKWYAAKIVKVDNIKKQILVHFNGWKKRFDTIFPMSSNLIRGSVGTEKKDGAVKFSIGDDVLSQWSDGTFYPGTVMNITSSGSYIVMFYDGLKKLVRPTMLKPMTEKEKEASLRAADQAYLASLEQAQPDVQKVAGAVGSTSFRRYRTSANDRERRIAARKSPSNDSAAAPPPDLLTSRRRAGRKRKADETDAALATPRSSLHASPTAGSQSIPPERFQAKRARLDKITHTLFNKVTTMSTATTASTVSTTASSNRSSPVPVRSDIGQDVRPTASLTFDSSDESDAPLVIDEDAERKVPKMTIKKPIKTAIAQSDSEISTPKRRGSSALAKSKDLKASLGSVQSRQRSNANEADENLHKLADAALLYTPRPSTDVSSPVKTRSNTAGSGSERKEASEALLQLSLSRPDDTPPPHVLGGTTAKSSSPNTGRGKKATTWNAAKLDLAVTKVLKNDMSLDQAAEELKVNVSQLQQKLLQRPGIISASDQPVFMSEFEEDDVVNWIHDVTDLGWGINDIHICQRIKVFLSEHSYSVLFDSSSPINYPSTDWLCEFLVRHPEIFPGRKKPLSRFRVDREGFEDWLVRWLAMLRSYSIYPNAVYYCDEVLWDASPKLLHDVKFTHGPTPLNMVVRNKISSLTCVGATGATLPSFHVFPANVQQTPPGVRGYATVSTQGVLNSSLFLLWLKHVFMKHVPAARPVALLVDWRFDDVDYDVLQFADKNQIVLFRFLPTAAHFLQHPDQKLFGRLRLQWKKTLINQFMKKHSNQNVTTEIFASFFDSEFRQVASPSTVKMCFELTKLYTPVAESEIQAKEVDKDKRNKRKRSKPIPYLEPITASGREEVVDSAKKEWIPTEQPSASQRLSKETKVAEDAESSDIESSSASSSHSSSEQAAPSTPSESAVVTAGEEKDEKTSNVDSSKQAAKRGRPKIAKTDEKVISQEKKRQYKKGETVLAKWSDCRLYLATIVKKLDDDKYKIRYFDGLAREVKGDFLRPWTGKMPVQPLPKPPAPAPPKKPTDVASKPVSTGHNLRRSSSEGKPAANEQIVTRRRSLNTEQKTSNRRTSEPDRNTETKRETRRSVLGAPDPTSAKRIDYKKGDTVLCRWSDRRMYPATILKQTDPDHYLVKYYDERKKVVLHTWLTPWKPVTSQQATVTQPATESKQKPTKPQNAARKSSLTEKLVVSVRKSAPPKPAPAKPEAAKIKEEPKVDEINEEAANDGANLHKTKKPVVLLGPDIGATVEPPRGAEKTVDVEEKQKQPKFKLGDSVMSRWSDCRSYPAVITKILENGEYAVKYYDGMSATVKEDFLQELDPMSLPRMRTRPRPKPADSPAQVEQQTKNEPDQLDVQSMAPRKPNVKWKASTMHDAVLAVRNGMSASAASRKFEIPLTTLRKKIATFRITVKPSLPSANVKPGERNKGGSTSGTLPKPAADVQAKGVAHGHIPKAPNHKESASDSEISRIKCRVPGCNKIFRKESALQQHHRHYHLQRYKLRDQEQSTFQKRKASREDHLPVKRRASSDHCATASVSPKRDAATSGDDRGPRSRGGKPPIDRMKQDMKVLQETSENDANKDVADKSPAAPPMEKDAPATEKSSPQDRKKKIRIGPRSPTSKENAETAASVRSTDESAKAKTESDTKGVEIVNEDIINCVCGEEEEDGYMLQCESCLTWQHGQCEGIDAPAEPSKQGKENGQKSPQGYVCTICRKPPNARKSRLYEYNNDFLTKGQLPDLVKLGEKGDPAKSEPTGDEEQGATERESAFKQIMLASHQLMEELVRMQETLHGIRLKAAIANPDKNHPLLSLWKKAPPDEPAVTDTSAMETAAVVPDRVQPAETDGAEPSLPTVKTTSEKTSSEKQDSNEASNSDEAPGNGSVLQTVKSVVLQMIRSVTGSSPSSVQGSPPAAEDSDGKDGRHEESMDVDEADTSSKAAESVTPESLPETPAAASSTGTGRPTASDDSEAKKSPECSAESGVVDVKVKGQSDPSDIWKPIEINRVPGKTLAESPSRRRSSKSDDAQEELLIRCRGNLLSHIHKLEESVAQRLDKLEQYVTAIQTAYDRHRQMSPSSSPLSASPSYDRRLVEMRSDMGAIIDDLDAVSEMLSNS